jgi:hypothetical protein
MRDDLLDADASVEWATTQMQMVQAAFLSWQRSDPYAVIPEHDSDSGKDFAVAMRRAPFPREIAAGVGGVINSCRCSLDLLAATLAMRNRVKPSSDTHFPIRKRDSDFFTMMNDIERKGWLAKPDIDKIKSLKPYKGGDDAIWPMHALDVLRKHERLLAASGEIQAFHMLGPTHFRVSGQPVVKRLEDKTILCEMAPEDVRRITQGNSLFVVDILLNETAIGLADEPARPALSRFIRRVREVIALFDY